MYISPSPSFPLLPLPPPPPIRDACCFRAYFVSTGLVTGGQYGSHSGCQPYSLPHCSHHEPGPYPNCTGEMHTPQCKHTCEAGYTVSYDNDKHFGETSYSVDNDVDKIMTEIMTNGPVEAAFNVYADFPTYRSGEFALTAAWVRGCISAVPRRRLL